MDAIRQLLRVGRGRHETRRPRHDVAVQWESAAEQAVPVTRRAARRPGRSSVLRRAGLASQAWAGAVLCLWSASR